MERGAEARAGQDKNAGDGVESRRENPFKVLITLLSKGNPHSGGTGWGDLSKRKLG